MIPMEKYLKNKGYNTVNQGYPSTKYDIKKLSEEYLADIITRNCLPSREIHFVTHSMGGILVRYYLKNIGLKNLGRVVMLAPPNGGSEVVDKLRRFSFFRKALGPASEQLGTGKNSLPKKLGPVGFELGVIAGCRSINPVNSHIIPGLNDGKVSVEGTKVAGMKDFIVVKIPHPFIMVSKEVLEQVEYFLRTGYFSQR